MKIIFYIHSPTSYQIDFFNELRKFYDVFVIYKHQYSQNYKFEFKKKKWMFFPSYNKSNLIKEYIRKIKPNIVIIGGYKMDLQIKDKNIKKFFWLERLDSNRNKLKIFLRKILIKSKLKTADGIFAIGKQAQKFYKSYNKRVYNIPYSIKQHKKINKYKKPKFLFVGQLIKRKGLENLIHTIKNIDTSDCSFTFVGEGSLKKEILNLSKIKKNVFYLKFQNKDNLEKIYNKNNILILPSIYDGWGVVIIEAMSRGMALISNSNVGAANEYIKHNFNGRLIKKTNNSLKDQITFFQKNKKKISIFGDRNIKLFQSNLCNVINLVAKVKKILQ